MEDRVFVNKCENVADEFFASLDRLEITKIPGENGNGVEFGKEPFSALIVILLKSLEHKSV